MARRGPIWGDEAAAALGLTANDWWRAVACCPWVTFEGPGPAGWTVTESGRRELARGAP